MLNDSASSIQSILQELISNYFEQAESTTDLHLLVENITAYHPWFTPDDAERRLREILFCLNILNPDSSSNPIEVLKDEKLKRIGVLMRGAIPLEGFEDVLAIVLSGNIFVGKWLEKTDKLTAYLVKQLVKIENRLSIYFEFVEDAPMRNLDGIVIYESQKANDALARYTDHLPHLIRPHRKSAAVLSEHVSLDELHELSHLVFRYFGRSPQSVSKLFVPQGFELKRIYEAFEHYYPVMQHNKYANNYQYHQSVYLMNKIPFLDNGFLLLKEDKLPLSPTAVLYYEYYAERSEIQTLGYEEVYEY